MIEQAVLAEVQKLKNIVESPVYRDFKEIALEEIALLIEESAKCDTIDKKAMLASKCEGILHLIRLPETRYQAALSEINQGGLQ